MRVYATEEFLSLVTESSPFYDRVSTKEVTEMSIPGFMAEAALCDVGTRYQATAGARFYGGIVQPAASDVFHPDQPVPFLSTQLLYPDRPVRCLKWECLFWDPQEPWQCRPGAWVRRIGVWRGGSCV
jgi:hypothetical protein